MGNKVSSKVKNKKSKPVSATISQVQESNTPSRSSMPNKKIAIIFYSTYGHVHKMAEAVKTGVDSIQGCEGQLFQVPEILSEEVLKKMHAAPKPDVPVITADKLADFDGFLFGFPTRFGAMPAQMKAFFDSTGSQWQSGALVGKPASIFVSVGTQSGGMETTVLTSLTNLAHHGMVIVPTGYSFGPEMFDVNTVRGGSAWGAGCYAGADGSRQPSDLELRMATHQGSYFAGVAKKLAA